MEGIFGPGRRPVGVSVFELRFLGPVQAVRDGRDVALGGPRRRAVLALLALDAGRLVPAGRLVEEVWRGQPPPGAAKTLRSYVSRLRSALAPEVAVVPRGGGYVLSADPGQLDVSRFEALVAEGQAVLGGGEAAAAGNRFREALALWRGPAFADVAEVEPLAREGARLEELRLAAVEGRLEADLAAGSHGEVAGELERLVREYPLRERLWHLLMLALYRGGRQADALAAYQRARTMLADELGLEPGPELQELERAVLRQEVPSPAPDRNRHNLPAQLTSFVGRDQELAMLGKLLGEARLVTLTGPGGAGKTRLAVEFAAAAVDRFADGVWLADLAGLSDPGLVGAQVMEALGVRQVGDVPVVEALRFRLRSAELLLVLDNCEHLLDACAQLAGGLLSSAPGLRVLATSREPLGVPGEAVCPVPPLALPAESADVVAAVRTPAVRLFLDRASAARPGVGPAGAPVAVIGRVCRELDGLPLAIELAAARTSTLSVEEVETHLADRFHFLAHRRPAADPRHQGLQAAIDWSYELLPAAEKDVFGQLSVFAGGFALAQAAQVCCGGDEAATFDLVDQLATKSLVVADTAGGQTRYRLLETVRHYAAGRLAETPDAGAARRRHAEAFLTLAERESDLAVLAREHDNFRAALSWSLPEDSQTGPRLARALGGFWLARGFLQEAQDWLERALATGPAEPRLRADLLRLLGMTLIHTDPERAEATLSEGSQIAMAAGLHAVQARIQVQLSEIHSMLSRSGPEALSECEAAAAVLADEGDLEGLAEAWGAIGTRRRLMLGDEPAAAEAFERAVTYARESGNHLAELNAVSSLVWAFQVLSVPADVAIARSQRYLEAASGDPWAEAAILQPLALLYSYAGRFTDARAAITRARSAQTRCGAAIDSAISTAQAGEIELMAGDPTAAEPELKKGCDALRATGERGDLSSWLSVLAKAEYTLGRLDEAHQLTEEAEALAVTGDLDTQVRWRATRAMILAQRGQFTAARQLAGEAEALITPTSWAELQAAVLVAKAEVAKLAGAPAEAAASLRKALRIYEDRRVVPLADRTRAALASLSSEPG
jgi:predicted ATPase/DNA-binding SARP family transcriptional activator